MDGAGPKPRRRRRGPGRRILQLLAAIARAAGRAWGGFLFVCLCVCLCELLCSFVCLSAQRMVLEKDALGLVQPEPMTAEKAKLNNPPARVVLTMH